METQRTCLFANHWANIVKLKYCKYLPYITVKLIALQNLQHCKTDNTVTKSDNTVTKSDNSD